MTTRVIESIIQLNWSRKKRKYYKLQHKTNNLNFLDIMEGLGSFYTLTNSIELVKYCNPVFQFLIIIIIWYYTNDNKKCKDSITTGVFEVVFMQKDIETLTDIGQLYSLNIISYSWGHWIDNYVDNICNI